MQVKIYTDQICFVMNAIRNIVLINCYEIHITRVNKILIKKKKKKK